jgi:CheY-like chemotaxis protein
MATQENYRLAYVVVDDDEDDRFILRLTLKEANRQLPVHEFSNGQEFIDYLTQHAAEYDKDRFNWLVVLDINMPLLNGLETLKQLRQNPRWSNFPVLMLSTSNDPMLIEKAYRLGANGYVTKPKSPAEFVKLFDQFFAPLLLDPTQIL